MEFDYERSLTREDALAAFAERWRPDPSTEPVMLDKAFGRVTARPVHSKVTLPVVRSSRMDGIAVRSSDFADGAPDTSGWKRDEDFAQADTGDDFPDAFDAVIAIERVHYENGVPHLDLSETDAIAPGYNVNPAGATVREGALVLDGHVRLTPERVAACAVAGLAQIDVLARPKVGFMATGSELVPWGSFPKRGQNLEANSLLVRGMVEDWGGECFPYPVVADDPARLEEALDRALEACDIVLVNGGSSRGEEDFNSQLIERRASWFVHGVRAVPGRPIGMALVNDKPVINMPGPVLAASLCMDWLVRGLMAQYFGLASFPKRTVRATLTEDVTKPESFERIMRVRVNIDIDGSFTCCPVERSAGLIETLRQGIGQVALPIGTTQVPMGAVVEVELLD